MSLSKKQVKVWFGSYLAAALAGQPQVQDDQAGLHIQGIGLHNQFEKI